MVADDTFGDTLPSWGNGCRACRSFVVERGEERREVLTSCELSLDAFRSPRRKTRVPPCSQASWQLGSRGGRDVDAEREVGRVGSYIASLPASGPITRIYCVLCHPYMYEFGNPHTRSGEQGRGRRRGTGGDQRRRHGRGPHLQALCNDRLAFTLLPTTHNTYPMYTHGTHMDSLRSLWLGWPAQKSKPPSHTSVTKPFPPPRRNGYLSSSLLLCFSPLEPSNSTGRSTSTACVAAASNSPCRLPGRPLDGDGH